MSTWGLPTKGYADQLHVMVAGYMACEGGPPPILHPVGGPVVDVQVMIQCLYQKISVVMSKTIMAATIESADRAIKLFLSSFECIDEQLHQKKEKHMWLMSYNFYVS